MLFRKNISKGKYTQGRGVGGFSRLDLIVGVSIFAFLGLSTVLTHFGERGRTIQCASNLNAFGRAMHSFVVDEQGCLPAASINVGKYHGSWDLQILPKLKPGLTKEKNEELAQTVPRLFACPSDNIAHGGTTRSYAMGSNDMALQNWPPSKESRTGVGLNWDQSAVLRLLNEDALKQPAALTGMKLSQIPVPSETVLVTEFIVPGNFIGGYQMASVAGSAEQTLGLTNGGYRFHGGKLNYVMADGHLERLTPLQTGSIDGTAGIWILKKND